MCHWCAYYPQICPYICPQNTAGARATATFPKRAALEALLGMNFVCHLLFPLCMYRSTHDFRLTFCTFLCFSWKCASCSSGEHGREGCFYANIWKRLLLASQRDLKGATLGGKISLWPPLLCSKFTSNCRASGNGPSWVWILYAICVSICTFLVQHTLPNHIFSKNASRCNGKHVFVKQLQAFCIRKSTFLTPKLPW